MPFIKSLAALSLKPPALPPYIPDRDCARSTSLRLTASSILRPGHDSAMHSPQTPHHVVEISSDDDDEDFLDTIHIKPSFHSTGPFAARHAIKDDTESEVDFDWEDDDPLAPRRLRPKDDSGKHGKSDYEKLFGGHHQHAPAIHTEAQKDRESFDTAGKQHSRLTLSFPGRHRSDHRASFTFSNEDSVSAEQPPRESRVPRQDNSSTSMSRPSRRPETKLCPYYYDQKLEVKMYRGPGYERFPVVLGSVEGHKTICDEWEAQHAKRLAQESQTPLSFKSHRSSLDATLLPPLTPSDSADDSDPGPSRPLATSAKEQQCLEEVLQVFPQIKHDFVRKLYRGRHSSASGSGGIQQSAELQLPSTLIVEIAEMDSIPRESELKRKRSLDITDDTGTTITWNKDIQKNHTYLKEAIILLAAEFGHIPTHYIYKLVHKKKSLFDVYNELSEGEIKYFTSSQKPYIRSKHPRLSLEKKYQKLEVERRDGLQYVSLVNELQAARQNQARVTNRAKKQKADDDKESENLALHVAQGSMIECRCCFDEAPINRAVPCEGVEIHFFCNGCVERQAQSQLGAMKYEMLCMDTSACNAKLASEGVGRAVSIQIYDKLALNQLQAEIIAAGIEGLEECPFCEFKAICDQPVEINRVFDCQNPDCGKTSCRKCGEESHLPKSCEEVKNDKGLSARHAVEEARSEAMMRTCPKCKVKIIKEYGCNKMVCTNCRTIMCYVCKKDISGTGRDVGYDHFHRSGATCVLHDRPTDDRHQQEADAAETAAIAKVKAEDADIDEKALRIEAHLHRKEHRPGAAQRVGPPLRVPVPLRGPAIDAEVMMRAMRGQPYHLPPMPAQLGNLAHADLHGQLLGLHHLHQLGRQAVGAHLMQPGQPMDMQYQNINLGLAHQFAVPSVQQAAPIAHPNLGTDPMQQFRAQQAFQQHQQFQHFQPFGQGHR